MKLLIKTNRALLNFTVFSACYQMMICICFSVFWIVTYIKSPCSGTRAVVLWRLRDQAAFFPSPSSLSCHIRGTGIENQLLQKHSLVVPPCNFCKIRQVSWWVYFSFQLASIWHNHSQGSSSPVVFSFRERGYLLGQDDLHPLGHHGAHPAVYGLGADVRDDGREWGGALCRQRDQHADALPVVGQLDEVVP